jgi:hypothetical protein
MTHRPALARDRATPHRAPEEPTLRGKRAASALEAENRYLALKLLDLGLRASDIRWICNVPDYFLRQIERDLAAVASTQRRRRSRGCTPGVWSLLRSRSVRLEAALFVVDWNLAGLPFVSRPDPAPFHEVYRRYRRWHWQDDRREPLEPSAGLALVRLIGAGTLLLGQCLHCRQLSVLPAPEATIASVHERCSFCGVPHPVPVRLGPDRRPSLSP